jgi:hypothetical protein
VLTALIVILLIIGFIAMFIHSKSFRWAVLVFVIIAVLGITLLIQVSEQNSKRYQEEQRQQEALKAKLERERWARVKMEDIQIKDAQLKGYPVEYHWGNLTATVRNSSAYDIDGIGFSVRLYDCAGLPRKGFSNCDVIGEAYSFGEAIIPAQQTREVSARFQFPNTPKPKGKFAWSYEVRGIRSP